MLDVTQFCVMPTTFNVGYFCSWNLWQSASHSCRSASCSSVLQPVVLIKKHFFLTTWKVFGSARSQLQQALGPLQAATATAARGMEASAPPTRAAPINLSALPRETSPLASPLASSSKERPPLVSSVIVSHLLSFPPIGKPAYLSEGSRLRYWLPTPLGNKRPS